MPHVDFNCASAPAALEIGAPRSGPPWRARSARLYSRAGAVRRVARDDSAIWVVTDFARDEPRTVAEERGIEDALREMVCAAVRALLVTREEQVVGLITSYDIEGRRPLEPMQSQPCPMRRDLKVQQVMTPWDRLTTLDWKAVCTARAGHIEEYFRNTRATHVVLVESAIYPGPYVRGLISRSRIEREMGRAL